MKNKLLQTILIFVLFNFIFLVIAKPAEAGVVNLCSGGWDCAVFSIGLLVTQFIWILFLLIGAVGLYKAFKKGGKKIWILSIAFIAMSILTNPSFSSEVNNLISRLVAK